MDVAHISPDPGSDFEQRLTLAMKRFTIEEYLRMIIITDY